MTEQTLEDKYTNKIRIKALEDTKKSLELYRKTTSLTQVRWWYDMAELSCERRKLIYK